MAALTRTTASRRSKATKESIIKARIVLALAMVLILVGSASAAASGAEVPFYTSLEVHPTPAGPITEPPYGLRLSVPGEGQVTHLGNCTWDAVMRVYVDGSQDGDMKSTAANGDELLGTFMGHGYRDSAGVSHFDGTYEFTGGTGRFWGVTNKNNYWNTAVLNSDGVLYFDGTLIK